MAPERFDCAETDAWVGRDPESWNIVHDPPALLVGRRGDWPPDALAAASPIFCPAIDSGLHRWLLARLAPSGQPAAPGVR